jgi:sec-independent protein translocase protein TatA
MSGPDLLKAELFAPQDLIVILLLALMLFGGKKLPEVASGLGKALREFKRATLEPEITDVTPKPIPAQPATEEAKQDRPRT